MHEIPQRIRWAVEILAVHPADVILEIGCGRGFAIGPICERLVSGHLTAIDRSEKMVPAAVFRSKHEIENGRVSILHTDLLSGDLPASKFDKIFLFNINVFWMDPIDELAEIKRLLKPNGKFYIFHQPPPGQDLSEFLSAFERNLGKSGFVMIDVLQNDNVGVFSGAIIAVKTSATVSKASSPTGHI